MASGRPSSLRAICAIAGAFSSSRVNPGTAAAARSANRRTDSQAASDAAVGRVLLVRDRERRDRAFLLAGNAQRRAAADQDPQRARLLQQPRHDRGAGQQVLEVVQDDQELPLAQLADQVLHQGPVPGVLQPDALGDRRGHQSRIPDGRQRHEVNAVRVVAGHLRGQGDAQPGLAAAARPGQRDQVAALEQPFRLRQLAFPADEAGQRLGQADPADAGPDRTRGIARPPYRSRPQACDVSLCQPVSAIRPGRAAAGDLSLIKRLTALRHERMRRWPEGTAPT